MAWLHTWTGLLLGWLLFFVFLTGTLGYYDTEIDRWMQPERPLAGSDPGTNAAVANGLRRLEAVAPGAALWFILPPNGRENTQLRIFWRNYPVTEAGRGTRGAEYLDATSGNPVSYRATGGGQFLYRLHYQLHYLPGVTGQWIVGVAAMIMLVAMLTGIVTHRQIFSHFFVLRLGRGQRTWTDIHNVLAVCALPFHLMITYTGLVFIMYLYMSPVIAANYGADEGARRQYVNEMFSEPPDLRGWIASERAPLPDLEPIIAEAARHGGAGEVRSVGIRDPGTSRYQVTIKSGPQLVSRWYGEVEADRDGSRIRFDDLRSWPKRLVDGMLSLHEGLFAGSLLRPAYFLSGLAGTALIGAGLVLWTSKRRRRLTIDGRRTLGLALVESLNVGTLVGLPIAIAAYFWANRLLPVGMAADRAAWEQNGLFLVWAAALAHAIVTPPARAWSQQMMAAAAAFLLLPVLNALTTNRHLGVSLLAGDWSLAGVDLFMLGVGAVFAMAARRIGRGTQPRSPG